MSFDSIDYSKRCFYMVFDEDRNMDRFHKDSRWCAIETLLEAPVLNGLIKLNEYVSRSENKKVIEIQFIGPSTEKEREKILSPISGSVCNWFSLSYFWQNLIETIESYGQYKENLNQPSMSVINIFDSLDKGEDVRQAISNLVKSNMRNAYYINAPYYPNSKGHNP